MTLDFDHLVIAVADLDAGAAFAHSVGIGVVAGGRHPGHGTVNAIAPLGDTYLELVTVVDPDEAAMSPFGRAVADSLARGGGLMGVSLRTMDLATVARRLDVPVVEMERGLADGMTLRWRLAGLAQALAAGLPFFIEWAVPPDRQPGYREPAIGAIDWVALPAPAATTRAWLGRSELDVRPGSDQLRAGLTVHGRSITLCGSVII